MTRHQTRRSLAIVAILAAAMLGLGMTALAGPEHVTVCHRTGSSVNPFVTIHPSANGAFHGHLRHPNDVIPPFEHQGETYQLNWPSDLVDVVAGECVARPGPGEEPPGEEEPPEVKPGPPIENEPPFTG